eukprot:403350173
MLSAWNLKDLRIPPQTCQIQDSIQGLNGVVVTCMHTPQFLTNEPENHDFLLISQLVIRFKLMFPDKSSAGDVVTDMKVDPQHMHRLLIAYENTAVVVYSLNKNRDIQRIVFSQYDQDRGKALQVNFFTPECQMFVVGYSSGQLCLYKSESKSQKPAKVIDMQIQNIYEMNINIVERSNLYQDLSVQYSFETATNFGKSSQLNRDIILISGKNFEQQFKISQLWDQTIFNDDICISAAAIFMLQAKYQTLQKMTFKIQDSKEDLKYYVFGNNIVDHIKDKNRSFNIYGASTLLILSNRLKLHFFNIDSLFKEIESSPNSQVQLWDKIYSHQEKILCSQLININTQKELQQISCFVEFRNIYIKRQLQQVFNSITQLRAM